MALRAEDLLFNTEVFLQRRQKALLRAQSKLKSPFFLHDFAIDGNIETIQTIKPNFENALELFSGNGGFVEALADADLLGAGKKIGKVTVYEPAFSQFAGAQFSRVGCINDLSDLPLDEDSYDFIIANSGLNWVNDLPGFLARIKRSLRKDGLFIGSFLGGGTLKELRDAFLNVESEVFGGASLRVSPMIDLESAVGLMRRVGFASPVSSSEVLRVRYANVFSLIRDIKNMGENAAFNNHDRAVLNRNIISKIADYYQEHNADDDGRVGATFEIVTVSAWN